MSEHGFILVQEYEEALTVRPEGAVPTPWTVRGAGLVLRFPEKTPALEALAFLEGRFPDDAWALEGEGRFSLA